MAAKKKFRWPGDVAIRFPGKDGRYMKVLPGDTVESWGETVAGPDGKKEDVLALMGFEQVKPKPAPKKKAPGGGADGGEA